MNGNARDRSPARPMYAFAWHTPIGAFTGSLNADALLEIRFPKQPDLRFLHTRAPAPLGSCRFESSQTVTSIPEPVASRAGQVAAFLSDYFSRRHPRVTLPIAWPGCGSFDRAIWQVTLRIPFGHRCTYGDLARQIGRPRAARPAGGALARNRIVLLVPCHRVIAKQPRRTTHIHLGGFSAGLELKQALLTWEQDPTR